MAVKVTDTEEVERTLPESLEVGDYVRARVLNEKNRAVKAEYNLRVALKEEVERAKSAEQDINNKIPQEASKENQLADKDFVKSLVSEEALRVDEEVERLDEEINSNSTKISELEEDVESNSAEIKGLKQDLEGYLPLTGGTVSGTINAAILQEDGKRVYSDNNPPPYPVTKVAGKTGEVTLSKSDVGLNNVENVLQYSENNPPPYPVTSVNGEMGDVLIQNSSESSSGLMSAEDKEKLDGIDEGANNYVLPIATEEALGGVKVGYQQSGKNYPVQLSEEKAFVSVPWENTTYEEATQSVSGLMSAADKTKLDNIDEAGYSLPLASTTDRGGIKLGYAQNGRNYPVQVSNERAFVNVPWTNTTYSVATASQNGLLSSSDKEKLDGIEEGANSYTLPTATNSALGGIKTGYTQTAQNYPLQVDSEGKAFVSVSSAGLQELSDSTIRPWNLEPGIYLLTYDGSVSVAQGTSSTTGGYSFTNYGKSLLFVYSTGNINVSTQEEIAKKDWVLFPREIATNEQAGGGAYTVRTVIVFGSTSATSGNCRELIPEDIPQVTCPVYNQTEQKAIGYFYQVNTVDTINNPRYRDPGEYGLQVAVGCEGMPYTVDHATQIIIKTYSSYYYDTASVDIGQYRSAPVFQELFIPENQQHYRRLVSPWDHSETGGSQDNAVYGDWVRLSDDIVLPRPTAADSGKVLGVDSNGNYVLLDLQNS